MSKKIKKSELGKGLGALLSSFDTEMTPKKKEIIQELSNTIAEININWIEPNRYQPRNKIDPDTLSELAESIKVHGLIQPITVRRITDTRYELIAGQRRIKAAKIAGLNTIPAFIRIADDQELMEMALIENIQRQELNALEIANTYQRLLDEFNLTHDQLAQRVGKSRSSITNFLGLLKLPPDILNGLKDNKISMGHARSLKGLEDTLVQLDFYKKTIQKELSVRDLEKLIKNYREPTSTTKTATPSLSPEYKLAEDQFRNFFESKVNLNVKPNGKGQIVIPFNSTDELNDLLKSIKDDGF